MQSKPMQVLPWTIRSSGITKSLTTTLPGRAFVPTPPPRVVELLLVLEYLPASSSCPPGETMEPLRIVKTPD